jgi:uncharacterized membrane protein
MKKIFAVFFAYLATLFVVWQIINYIAFRTSPNLPSSL